MHLRCIWPHVPTPIGCGFPPMLCSDAKIAILSVIQIGRWKQSPIIICLCNTPEVLLQGRPNILWNNCSYLTSVTYRNWLCKEIVSREQKQPHLLSFWWINVLKKIIKSLFIPEPVILNNTVRQLHTLGLYCKFSCNLMVYQKTEWMSLSMQCLSQDKYANTIPFL